MGPSGLWTQVPAACLALPFPPILLRPPSDFLFGFRMESWEPRSRGFRPWVRFGSYLSSYSSCVTLAESLILSELQFPHLQNGYHEWTHLTGLWGFRSKSVWYIHRTQFLVAPIIVTVAKVAPSIPSSSCSQSPLLCPQALTTRRWAPRTSLAAEQTELKSLSRSAPALVHMCP